LSTEHFENIANKFSSALSKLSHGTLEIDKNILSDFEEMVLHLNVRAKMPRRSITRLRVILAEYLTGHYGKYSNGFYSIAKDLLMP
jgi:hypothetical protein